MYILKQIANDKLKNYFNCKTPVDSVANFTHSYLPNRIKILQRNEKV